MNGCTEGKGFYTDIITTGCMSYDPYGHDTPEYSHAKVATMDKLRKEANEYHDPDWRKRSISREAAAQTKRQRYIAEYYKLHPKKPASKAIKVGFYCLFLTPVIISFFFGELFLEKFIIVSFGWIILGVISIIITSPFDKELEKFIQMKEEE